MCTSSSKMNTILDPANLAGKREGGISIAGGFDPGGAILKKTTGSDIGNKLGDPLKLYPKIQEKSGFTPVESNVPPVDPNAFIKNDTAARKRRQQGLADKLYNPDIGKLT